MHTAHGTNHIHTFCDSSHKFLSSHHIWIQERIGCSDNSIATLFFLSENNNNKNTKQLTLHHFTQHKIQFFFAKNIWNSFILLFFPARMLTSFLFNIQTKKEEKKKYEDEEKQRQWQYTQHDFRLSCEMKLNNNKKEKENEEFKGWHFQHLKSHSKTG